MLLMALPNEHLMTFNQYKDVKTLFAAIKIRFDGNEATKKTQKTLLKQLYENFSATRAESLDYIFNRIHKIVSQLAVLEVFISQEDLNLKFLRSLPSKWNTQVVVWRNKSDLDTMSIDDLYNNFKIVEQEVKGTTSSNSSSQNMAFVSSPSPSSTNKVPTAYRVSTASTQSNTASTKVSTANLSDTTSYMAGDEVPTNMALIAFLAQRPRPVNTVRPRPVNTTRPNSSVVNAVRGNPQQVQEDQGYVDSGCSRHMTGNMSYLSNFKDFNRGYVTFRGGANGGRITSKGIVHIGNLNFEDVYFVKELKFNLFSFSQMCDKKNNVLFIDTGCLVLSPNFKFLVENQILLRVPRRNNMYSVDMKNIVLKESLTCLVAKAILDELMIWHRMLGHINFKNINKLVKDNLVRGLP
uniref:Ribonuclease H-like domain-containing protein n=1 Tax=Tanacetum cinerariifolium TaxID=118510 RepID=A0A6L2N1A1_TANCI|nr:ribonuclease H-like domain-containing protein [Tanacetum cinerariifolium]